jgi:hypothetical protein
MFGHVDRYHHWAVHLLRILELQRRSGGITEFVPLSFVADEAPIYRRGQSRRGPTLRESVLMHAVSRLVLSPDIPNIQTSWVKMGLKGASLCLQAGANDIGGTLMNESITRAAGAKHGQEMTAETLEKVIESLNRRPYQRNTIYDPVASHEQQLIGNAYTDFYGNPVRDQSFPRSRRRPAGTGWVSRAKRAVPEVPSAHFMQSSAAAFRRRREQGSETPLFTESSARYPASVRRHS